MSIAESAKPAYDAPHTTTPVISREQILAHLSSPALLLVDVRRTDYEGGLIAGSINLSTQTFLVNRARLYDLCRRAGVRKVAFNCGTCPPQFIILWYAMLRNDRILRGTGYTKRRPVCGLHGRQRR